MKMVYYCEIVHFRFLYPHPSPTSPFIGSLKNRLMIAEK